MNAPGSEPELNLDDRLKAIAYQFVKLYERWSEDRQVAAKQGAELSELVTTFTQQVDHFMRLEGQVRQQLVNTIQTTSQGAVKTLSEVMSREARQALDKTTSSLEAKVHQASQVLSAYESEVVTTQWKVIAATVITTVATCLLAVWLLIPAPTLALTQTQVKELYGGQIMNQVWPKLTKKERRHWLALRHQIEHPEEATTEVPVEDNLEDSASP